ncbi:hypothetical protein CVT24_001723 [Panaeolus cyanescens]|uniref:F-box domain-containing protein n=1 Tax=Panaeolus cyanescens TaxID=181874 RepID=A0A409YUC4_9AGAR|nr:hypothetical protein CVT24_001723 [Panaeolus cyanescens]
MKTRRDKVVKPDRKKQKQGASTNTKADANQLVENNGTFVNLPVDVLLEIFPFLHPLDLVHLCRTSSALRELLRQPSIAFTWKASYRNVTKPFPQPPPCPPGRNIAAYTAFLYCTTCNFCGAKLNRPSQTHHPTSMIVACGMTSSDKPCSYAKNMFKSVDPYSLMVKSRIEADPALALCNWFPPLSESGYGASRTRCLVDEYKTIFADISAVSDVKERAEKIKHYQDARQQNIQHAIEVYGFLVALGNMTYSSYLVPQEDVHEMEPISSLLKMEGYDTVPSTYRDKLIEWMNTSSSVRPELCAPNLTLEQVWHIVRRRVIWNLEQYNLEGLEQRIMDSLTKRLDTFVKILRPTLGRPKAQITPTLMDFIQSSPFQEVIKDTSGKVVKKADFEALLKHVPAFIEDWRNQSDQHLLNLIPESTLNGGPATSRVLRLAKTFFECYWCSEPISYPRVLHHSCLRTKSLAKCEEYPAGSITMDDDEDKIRSISDPGPLPGYLWRNLPEWYDKTGSRPWNSGGNQVGFHADASACATRVIEAMGFDPDTATPEFMHAQDGRVECLTCTQSGRTKVQKRLIMTWTMAILHDEQKHAAEGSPPSIWGKVNSNDTETAKEMERQVRNKASTSWEPALYTCKTCNEDVETKMLITHLKRHKIRWSGIQTDFTVSIDNGMKRPPYAVRI